MIAREALEADEVHVWHRVSETAGVVPPISINGSVLSLEECARRDRFRVPEDRRDYAHAHDLLRRSLSVYAPTPPVEWRFDAGAYGKPALADGGLSFNLSHTRGLVACVIARSLPVGVDVERTTRDVELDLLAARFFSAPETASLSICRTDARTRFFDLWTLKEAFIKATGKGLSQPLRSFSFDLDVDDRSIHFAAPDGFDAAEWQFALYAPLPDARLAVAVHAPRPTMVRWRARQAHAVGVAAIDPIRTSAA